MSLEDIPLKVTDGDKGTDWLLPPIEIDHSAVEQSRFSRRSANVMNQGTLGTCVGVSGKVVVEDVLPEREFLSAMHIYHHGQLNDSIAGEDYDGTTISGALRGLRNAGCCKAELWPYNETEASKPKTGSVEDALTRKIESYYRLNLDGEKLDEDLMKTLLMKQSLWISVNAHDYLYNIPDYGNVYEDKYLASKNVGGHAMAIVGWATDIEGNTKWEIQNSWGTTWGADGYCWMSTSLLEKILLGGIYYILPNGEELTEIEANVAERKESSKIVYIIMGVVAVVGAVLMLL